MGAAEEDNDNYNDNDRLGLNSQQQPFLDNDNDSDPSSPSADRERQHEFTSKFYGETESHQYEQDENEVWKHHQIQRHFEDKGHWWTFSKKRDVRRWTLTLLTGFLCGLVALLVTFFTKLLTKAKYRFFNKLVASETAGEVAMGTSFAFLVVCNLFYASVAWFMVYLEPLASGSGIPEIKCFLNGLNVPRVVRVKTLLCKACGIVFSCSSGLPLGKEGPMVHAGSVIAAGVSQGRSTTIGLNTAFSKFQDFRNDREKRDFVACGAAAGVAAAFGAPIGGVLFALEESASFWSTTLTWRCFFCAMTTVFTLYIINSASSFFGHSDSTAMFSFGEFFSLQREKSNYSVWELALFILIGAMGGLVGAVFNSLNAAIFRAKSKLKSVTTAMVQRCLPLTEVILIALCMSALSFLVPAYLWPKCTPLPVDMEEWGDQEKNLVEQLVPLYCAPGTHYNELASLYLTDSDTAIKQLFHFREIGDRRAYDSTFSSTALLLFVAPYLLMACVTSAAAAVPAGMFVPSLLSGAAFGRLVGHLLHKLDNTRGTFADSGTYALMGAAAITSGITRMTISLTVMILEATGDMQYVLPLMITVMTARMVGNIFTEGLYDMFIHLRFLNFLDEDESITHLADLHDISISDVMTKRPICLKPVVRVGDVFDMLKKVAHHCFPIVDDDVERTLCGTVTRKVICTLIKHKAFGPPRADPYSSRRISPLVNWQTLECIYPRYPDVGDLQITESERACWLDLRPYIDFAAYTVSEHCSIQRAYRMFRTLGLRQLSITDKHNRIMGIITRADLVATHIMRQSTVARRQAYDLLSISPTNSNSSLSAKLDSLVDDGASMAGSGGIIELSRLGNNAVRPSGSRDPSLGQYFMLGGDDDGECNRNSNSCSHSNSNTNSDRFHSALDPALSPLQQPRPATFARRK